VYHQGSFYCTLKPVESEQPLLDDDFPVIGRRGQGYQIKTYTGDDAYRKLTLWQVQRRRVSAEDIASAHRRLFKSGGNDEGKAVDGEEVDSAEGKLGERDEDSDPDSNRDIARKVKGKARSSGGADYQLNDDGLSDGEESDGGDDMQDEMYPERAQGASVSTDFLPLDGMTFGLLAFWFN
jgi:hypothetical protein